MAEVSLANLHKVYPNGFEAIHDLSLDIADGEFLVLVGPSGCGKSTALRMVAGLEAITSGTLTIDGVEMNDVEPKDRNVAMVFQNYALYPHMNVGQNIGFSLRLAHLPKPEIERRVREAAQVLELEPLLGNKPAQLSGGQRQRVAMGRAIVRDPAVFLMDEPLSNLDAKLRVQMRAEIFRLQHRLGATTLYVTHDQVEAMTMGDRVAVIHDGLLQQIADPTTLYERPTNLFVAGFIGSPTMNLRLGRLVAGTDGWGVELGTNRLPLPASVVNDQSALAGFKGRDVVVGIRPEAMEDAAIIGDSGEPRLSVDVELTEALGSDLLVHFPLDAKPVDLGDPDALDELDETPLLVARVDPRSRIAAGDRIELTVDTGRLPFFDPATQLAVPV